MHNFTPVSGLIGGALIGLASALLMLLTGRIAGISGIFAGVVSFDRNERDWRLAFLAGLIAAPLLVLVLRAQLPHPTLPASLSLVLISGLLVGVGSRIGGGCTSGHGVCGIARFSARSLVFTAVFMTFAIVTVAIARHVVGG